MATEVEQYTDGALVEAFGRAAMNYGQSDPALVFDPARSIYGERCVALREELLRRLAKRKA